MPWHKMHRASGWLLLGLLALVPLQSSSAHDTWVEVNTPLQRAGEVVHVSLKLGNHENRGRDFKLAGLITIDWTSLDVIDPAGEVEDLTQQLKPTSSKDKEGYWLTTVDLPQAGMYTVVQSLDRVMSHGTSVRGIRTAKTHVFAANSLDHPDCQGRSVMQPVGLPFELILETCPLKSVQVGAPLQVRLLKQGEPLADTVISFIPFGEELSAEFDPRYERRTDVEGRVEFEPEQAGLHLIVAKQQANDERTDDYEFTSYATTLTLHVPQRALRRVTTGSLQED